MEENMTTATTETTADNAASAGQTAADSAETQQNPAGGETKAGEDTPAEKNPAEEAIQQLIKKFEKEKAAAVAAAAEEAAKKATMKPEEAAEYDRQQKETAIAQKEKELQIREMRNDTKDILLQKNIPASFAEFLLGEDMEHTQENITVFKKEFDAAVQAQVEQRLKGTTPKVSSGIVGTANTMSAEIDKYL